MSLQILETAAMNLICSDHDMTSVFISVRVWYFSFDLHMYVQREYTLYTSLPV